MTGSDERSVVLLGKGSLAIRIGQWFSETPDFRVSAVVPVIPEPTWTESFTDWAHARHIATVESGDYRELLEGASAIDRVDLAFSVFYDRIIRPDFIERCRRILNLHNSPLPRYRGISPINWALKNGECMHGVTIHEITPGIDDGPIVAESLYPIYPEIDEVRDVYQRALAFGWTLFEQVVPMLDRIEPTPQDEREATYYSAADSSKLGDRIGFTREASASAPGSTRS
jgi:methionyl-tRNA formyltransferase